MSARGDGPIPWRDHLGIAVTVLRLGPRDFWAMTPMELQAALDAHIAARVGHAAAGRPPSRAEVAEMMARFPD